MVTRRSLLRAGPAAAMLSPFVGATPAFAEESGGGTGSFRFGVVADPQFAPVVPNLRSQRYYGNSLWKLSEAIAEFNRHEDLAFVVTLGDIIDRHWESFSHVLPVYDQLSHRKLFVLGNHDFDVADDWLGSVVRTAGLPAAYYDLAVNGVRFVVLDGNDVSTFAPPKGDPRRALAEARLAALKAEGADNAQSWNGSLSEAQTDWLKGRMDAAGVAGERVIVLCHYPVYPANQHNLWDSEALVTLLTGYPHFLAWFNGHNHAGNYGVARGKHFLNFRGMVDTPDTSAFSIVSVHADRIEVAGFGREENRTLSLSAS
jgi:hypothetical protein